MSLLSLVVILIAVGILLWAFNTYVTTIDARIKQIINVVVIICAVVFVLSAFGVFDLVNIPVPRLGRR
jgi:hypothetical protein